MEVIIVLLFIGPLFIPIGLWLVFRAIHPAPRPPAPDANVPVAQVVVDGHSRIREPIAPSGSAGGRVARFVGGAVSLAYGVGASVIIHDLFNTSYSKGRLLRLRGRAHLPEVGDGGGWTDGATPRVDTLSSDERRVLAAAWLASARMEHASIPAFALLSMHLAALGAPSELVERSHRAALDELAHARRCFAIASAYAGRTLSAGPIPALGHGSDTPIDFIRLAVGSLIDGCLAEGIAADVAARGARTAADPVIRDAFAMIARDEATHAEVGWAVMAWALAAGGPDVAAAVDARVARLRNELAPSAPELVGFTRDWHAAHGLCDQETLGDLAVHRIEHVRARARDLLAIRKAA